MDYSLLVGISYPGRDDPSFSDGGPASAPAPAPPAGCYPACPPPSAGNSSAAGLQIIPAQGV
eukprot:7073917-Prymnesium_polylepis.1